MLITASNRELKLFLVSFIFIFIAVSIFFISVETALAQGGGNAAMSMRDNFVNKTDGWWKVLKGYALTIFLITLTLEVVLFGIRMALQQAQLGEILGQFVMLLLFAGFIAAVINNYQSWAASIAIKGLAPVVTDLSGGKVDAGKPFAIAAKIWELVLEVAKDASIWNSPKIYILYGVTFVLTFVFVLISALVIVVTCEFYIVANVGVLLIGLAAVNYLKITP